MRLALVAAGLAALVGCGDIPPVNTDTISTMPAPAQQMAKARQVVSTCSRLPDADAMFAAFAARGREAGRMRAVLNNGRELAGPRMLSFEDEDVIVQVSDRHCYVGVRGMTPAQSFQLAQPWVDAFDAITNADAGQGLSPHVVQAWRIRNDTLPVGFIAAHKTWPWDRGRWPEFPGAAVTLEFR